MGWVEDGLKNCDDICFFGEFFDFKEFFELLKSYGYGCFVYEFNYCGMG